MVTKEGKVEHILNFTDSSFVNEDPTTGTCAVGLTRENLTLSGFEPIKESTKMLLSDHYTGVGLARIEYRHQKIAAQRGMRPVVKKSATQEKAPVVKKPTQKSMQVMAEKQRRSHVYMPSGVVPAHKPDKAPSRSQNDREGIFADLRHAKANIALAALQKTVGSDLDMLDGFHLPEITTRVLHYLAEEVPGISRDKVSAYMSLVKEKVFDIVRERIEETGRAELKFDKNGPTGDLKIALDSAYEEYSKVYKGVPAVDLSDMKGFNMGESQEEYDSPRVPTGDMTIEADGKITVKENDNSPARQQDGGQAQ
jgi:hypothetical protein